MRIDPRYGKLIMALFMSSMITMVMSFAITLFSLRGGWTPFFWLRAWGLAFSLAFPLILILAPLGIRLVTRLTGEPPR